MGNMGEQLRKARLEKEITQQELGALIGVSKHSIIKYEKDEREPNLETLTKIINILDLDFWDIAPIENIELEPTSYKEGERFYQEVMERVNASRHLDQKIEMSGEYKRLQGVFNSNSLTKLQYSVLDIYKNLYIEYSKDTEGQYRSNLLDNNIQELQNNFYSNLRSNIKSLIKISIEKHEMEIRESVDHNCRHKVRGTIEIIKAILDKNNLQYEMDITTDYPIERFLSSEMLKIKISSIEKEKVFKIFDMIANKEEGDFIYKFNEVRLQIQF